MELKYLNWKDVESYLENEDRAIIPMGSTEQHGPFGIFGTDHLIAENVAVESGRRTGTLVLPTVSIGMSLHHLAFSGSLSLKPRTIEYYFDDVFHCLSMQGFRRIIVINGHGGNRNTMGSAFAALANKYTDLRLKFMCWWEGDGVKDVIDAKFGDREGHHSSPSETSMIMHLLPGVLKTEPVEFIRRDRGTVFPNRNDFRKIYPRGIVDSDVNLASAEHGKELFEQCVTGAVKEIDGNW